MSPARRSSADFSSVRAASTDDFRLVERSGYEATSPSLGLRGEEQMMATTVVQYQVKPERAEENHPDGPTRRVSQTPEPDA